MTSPGHSFPTPTSSISTALSSRRRSWTATSTSPPPAWPAPDSTCGPPRSRQHFLTLLAEHVAAHPDGVVWGHGWDQSGWPDREVPTTAELDAVVGRRPAYLARVDVHSALASTALREQAPGLDAAAGYDEPGPLSADAHHRVRAAARALLSAAQRAEARTAALDAFAAAGVVAVHECAGPDIGGLDDWRELRATPHGVEVTGYWGEAVTTAARGAFAHRDHRRARAGRRPVRRRCAGLAHRVAQPCVRRRTRLLRQPVPRRRRDRRPPRCVYGGAGARGFPRHR